MRDEQADMVTFLQGDGLGESVGLETILGNEAQDLFARYRVYIRFVVQDARDRGLGYTSNAGNFADSYSHFVLSRIMGEGFVTVTVTVTVTGYEQYSLRS